MTLALGKLERLTSTTGIDFSGKQSSHRDILETQADPEGTLTRLLVFVSGLTVTDLVPILQTCFADEKVFRQLAVLFSNSPILARYFSKNPRKYLSLFPLRKITVEDFAAEQKEILNVLFHKKEGESEDILTPIREEKVRQFLAIALADYTALDRFEETVAKISLFAEMAIAYALHYSGLASFPLSVIAMGKLGGQELNYHSDIDIMFATDDTIEKVISPENLIGKIHRFITILDQLTADGFVFKVDLRIRPEGDQGPLFLTLRQYQRYYETRAQSWEFQALIKARVVGGDPQVGKSFEDFRKRFVFNPDFSSKKMLFSIARIKNTIEVFHQSRFYDDVKLSPGGIRDLEFTVQFLQIHHGKITRILSSPNTLSTLDKFLAYNLITLEQHRDFRSHYCFLRRIEHYLQLIDLQPVRKIPSGEIPLLIISRMMGYGDTREFLHKIKEVMDYNRDFFVRIFKLTVAFHEKIEEIHKRIQDWEEDGENPYLTFFENHIGHLESDYFLNFDTPTVLEHIRLLKQLTDKKSPLELSLVLEKDMFLKANLVTYDNSGIFSLISALFSVHGISILNGASFLYQPNQDPESTVSVKNKMKFSSRLFWGKHPRYSSSTEKVPSLKKVVFSMEGVFVHVRARQEFSEIAFREDLLQAIERVREKGYAPIMERILFRSIDSMEKYGVQSLEGKLKPIQMTVNNDSHPLYTLIDIESEDSFLFLFFFTYALSYKGYYIVKVEFTTPKNRVRNRLFLTDRKREKIVDHNSILELKSSILMIKYFSRFMAYAPNPALAYKTFNRLIEKLNPIDTGQGEYHDSFRDLAKVLGTGEVIMEDFLRLQHNDIRVFLGDNEVKVPLTLGYLKEKLEEVFSVSTEAEVEVLNRFKDRYLFLLDLRLLTGEVDFEAFRGEMTTLTDVVMEKAIKIALTQSQKKFSLTREPGRHAVVALGKWGSREMGYSSDVELVFLYDGLPKKEITSSVKEFYIHAGNLLPSIIRSKKNGIFELDLRLRPGGETETIAVSLTKYQNYYREGGGYLNYEKMVLTRLRVVSSTGGLREEILSIKDRFVYELGEFDLDDYLSLRQKQIDNLVDPEGRGETPHPINLKFSPGGLVEIEYLLQFLSIHYGKIHPQIRRNDTLGIAQALFLEKLISETTYHKIVKYYTFLRNLINCMRIIRGNSKDLLLPERDSLEIEYLKRTMVNFQALAPSEDLFDKLQKVREGVMELHHRYITRKRMKNSVG